MIKGIKKNSLQSSKISKCNKKSKLNKKNIKTFVKKSSI